MTDLLALEDLDPTAREVDTKASLYQDNYHRMIEGKGSNVDDVDRGVGVFAWLNAPVQGSYKHLIERELIRDARNSTVVCEVVATGDDDFRIGVEYTHDNETVGIEVEPTGLVTT